MSRGVQPQATLAWWVHADERVWGPYAEARLRGFVAEGRVSRSTLVGASDQGPFVPAGLQDDLWSLFAEVGGPPIQTPMPDLDVASAPAAPQAGDPSPSSLNVSPHPSKTPSQGGAFLSEAGLEGRRNEDDRGLSDVGRPASLGSVQTGASRPLLVFAALKSLGEVAFETVLAQHGPYQRIGEGLWLLRARVGPAALRNALSRHLRRDDALLIVEADLEKAAWFNLEVTEERRVRALWAQ